MDEWIEALRETRCVADACRKIGIGVSTAYYRRWHDEDFAAAWDDAVKRQNEELLSSAMRRAIEGWLEPVFHEGAECGYKRKFSDTLTIFLLKTRWPKQYHDAVVAARETAELGLRGDDGDESEPDPAYE